MAQTYTVLNVEDMKPNRDLVRRILESRGYQVVDAVNGLEGITKAVEITPDLILMDINLPDLDGFSVVTRIRSHPKLAAIPIIALTARNVSDDAERAKAIGCDGYLSKPIGVTELLEAVSARIGKVREKEEDTRREHFLREHSAQLVEELERKFNELSQAHKELSVVHDELSLIHERLQRLDEAKTDFIHIAAHELRTPLTTVTAYADMLRKHPRISGDVMLKEMLEGLKTGVDRLSNITNDMISIARVELSTIDLAYTPLSLNVVVAPVVKEVTPAINERNLTLEVNVPSNLPMVMGDDVQLTQVFSRLVGNAIKYTPDHGRITIGANIHRESQSAKESDVFLDVTVTDTGIGINKKDQGLIFEKFYTVEDSALHSSGKTKFRAGGPGLGLTIAKGIVEAHGGRIWVESEGYDPQRNPGSAFHVLLPAYEEKN